VYPLSFVKPNSRPNLFLCD